MRKTKTSLLVGMVCVIMLLGACGQKGALYIPEKKQ